MYPQSSRDMAGTETDISLVVYMSNAFILVILFDILRDFNMLGKFHLLDLLWKSHKTSSSF